MGHCTPSEPCADGMSAEQDMMGRPVEMHCTGCGRPATPEEAEAERERRYDASLPDMTGYEER